MNKYLLRLISFAFLLPFISEAQIENAKFFIRFTDKNNSPYSIGSPSAYLSARALQRRANQNISIDIKDLPVNPQYCDSLLAKGATLFNKSKWFNGVTISVPDSVVYRAVLALPFVQSDVQVHRPSTHHITKNKFENDFIQPLEKTSEPQAEQIYNYGFSYNQIHLMNGEYLHQLGYTGSGMVIALLDAGYFNAPAFRAFDSLYAREGVLGAWNFVDNDGDVFKTDANGGASHGMSCLSTIAGNIPDTLVGTAPDANFYLLVSEDNRGENIIEEYNWSTAAEYADSAGADVISTSLGYNDFPANPFMNHTYADMNGHTCPSSVAANVASSKGMLVVAAAGNSGNDAWHYIVAPGDADSAICTGAVDANGFHAFFSSNGPSSDGDVKPNADAKGYGTTVATSDGFFSNFGNGTSFATPVLAGAVTCLWQAHPTKTNMEIRDAVQRSANYFSNPNDSLGYGIPNFQLAHQLLSGIDEIGNQQESLIVFPSPFHDEMKFLFHSTTAKNITVEIFDVVGKKIYSEEKTVNANADNTVPVPASAVLANGIYFLKVKGERVFMQAVVKM
jgi:serine protease AprX